MCDSLLIFKSSSFLVPLPAAGDISTLLVLGEIMLLLLREGVPQSGDGGREPLDELLLPLLPAGEGRITESLNAAFTCVFAPLSFAGSNVVFTLLDGVIILAPLGRLHETKQS